ncbi:MAG: hypothetical protein IPK19_13715 [Chloroflexi bacterium]|nr:hypothetical protein [Chloroflexota bacterium]
MRKLALLFALVVSVLTGACSGGAVVFAPTPAPADVSPVRYAHPSGAFSLNVPRQWARYEQNTTTLASVSFSPPGAGQPSLSVAAVKLDASSAGEDFAALLDLYQTQIRPDTGAYKEEAREAMGDGSWRFAGLRAGPGNATQSVNTFVERAGDVIGVIEVLLPAESQGAQDPTGSARWTELQNAINTFELVAEANLNAAPLSTLTFVKEAELAILHVAAWSTPTGAFYITGEVANYGLTPAVGLPVEAVLLNAEGGQVAGAVDVVMGHAIPPGGFAPFSLRFGEGQANQAASYVLTLGNDWQMAADPGMVGEGALVWTDSAEFDAFNRLVIRGTVTNTGSTVVRQPRAMATVFDSAQNVTGAVWIDLPAEQIVPGAAVDFEIVVGEYGGAPENYIITVQGLS